MGGLILADGVLVGALLGVARVSLDPAVRFWASLLAASLLVSMAGLLPSWLAGQGRVRTPADVRDPPDGTLAGARSARTAVGGASTEVADDHGYRLAASARGGHPHGGRPVRARLAPATEPSTAGSALLPGWPSPLVLVFTLIVVELLLAIRLSPRR